MSRLEAAPTAAAVPLVEVKRLVQRYTLPRENMFRAPGQVLAVQ